jgi:hypothetical protein
MLNKSIDLMLEAFNSVNESSPDETGLSRGA